jgi:predicted RNase H-like nuclease (RuvC/YqgF family)
MDEKFQQGLQQMEDKVNQKIEEKIDMFQHESIMRIDKLETTLNNELKKVNEIKSKNTKNKNVFTPVSLKFRKLFFIKILYLKSVVERAKQIGVDLENVSFVSYYYLNEYLLRNLFF